MQNKIRLEHPIFKIVSAAAAELQMEVYAVGGYVRDRLLERNRKDIDFVCLGNGIEPAEKTAAKIDPSIPVTVFKTFWHRPFQVAGFGFGICRRPQGVISATLP